MAFTVSGVATVSDVRDGVSPPTIYLTNENHTFVADADGSVMSLNDFSTEVQVFVGTDEYAYQAGSGAATGTNFRIGAATVTPATANITVTVSSTGVVTLSDTGTSSTGFVDGETINSFTVTLPVTVGGFGTTSFNRVITLSKSIGGSAPLIRVESNTQTVEYDQTGVIARTENIVITANELNFTSEANVIWEARTGGVGAYAAFTGGTFVRTTPETLTLTPAQFSTALGSSRTWTIRARRGGTITSPALYDQITIARVNDGEAAVTVVINTISGSNILRSDTDAVTLRADVYQAGTLLTPEADWNYTWSKDGTTLTATNVAAQTGNANTGYVEGGTPTQSRSLIIEGDGITDGGASLFSCEVEDPT